MSQTYRVGMADMVRATAANETEARRKIGLSFSALLGLALCADVACAASDFVICFDMPAQ